MNRHSSDRDHDRHEREFHTRRSERYRHPEQDSGYRFDDYGSAAHGGYGNETYQDTWGNQGNERGGSRNYSRRNITDNDTYSSSRNYGNMGSYGGAQGFGDSRGGRHDSDHPFDSGMGSQRRYGSEGRGSMGNRGYREEGRDYSRHNRYGSDREDLYGNEVSRRFEGSSGQGRYDFERDDYYSSNYGDDQGNYMGSGYNRETRSRYGEGDYGSSGFMQPGNRSSGSQGRRDRDRDRDDRRPREFNTAQNRWSHDW
ncbi:MULTISPECIES: hypothetical protein [Pontibacter]|uniref:Uncharacterized protein n=1 Tax=Pontibacter lucknowensis TaxID=1077936 RepID=A0A1N6ZGH3_9BACT|nr:MULTISPECIES: hypothetical protein [Pontibacter]EJF09405.1 hypothetical protein O71_15405 [Pontibacter sp. BAB1700]SIR25908.1 hypothetical protein SAMN05421545_2973 [Pontibacter lucknowensis]